MKNIKDKKFVILCGLGTIWLIIFGLMLNGIRINPRVEMLISFLCVGWFAYWSISLMFANFPKKDSTIEEEISDASSCNESHCGCSEKKKEKKNANPKKSPKSDE